ncbi:hypothetical protein [Chryseobacterium sp. 52]|uniref:hypothetical protein n=1 Tax=Chryseobacterium sp. 52 TaxID=2035213 RepID=UPI00117FD430|nr:hypothetical protein [Chryseobacterium sp. 52]
MKNIVLLHGKCIDLQIPNNVMVTDIKGDRLLLKKLIEKPATIYRINETNCFTCVEKFLPELEKMAQKSDVIILGTYSDPRNLFLALKNYVSKKIKIYNIEKNSLAGTKIEGVDIPYIFDIDPELKSSNFFIPQKEIPELSSYYQMNHY